MLSRVSALLGAHAPLAYPGIAPSHRPRCLFSERLVVAAVVAHGDSSTGCGRCRRLETCCSRVNGPTWRSNSPRPRSVPVPFTRRPPERARCGQTKPPPTGSPGSRSRNRPTSTPASPVRGPAASPSVRSIPSAVVRPPAYRTATKEKLRAATTLFNTLGTGAHAPGRPVGGARGGFSA